MERENASGIGLTKPKGNARLAQNSCPEVFADARDGVQEQRHKLTIQLTGSGLREGFKAEISAVADFMEAVAEVVPVDGADVGHAVLVVAAVVVVDMQRLDALADDRHIDAEALAEQIDMAGVEAEAKAFLAGLCIQGVDVFNRLIGVGAGALDDPLRRAGEEIFQTNGDLGVDQNVNEALIELIIECFGAFGGVGIVGIAQRDAVDDQIFATDYKNMKDCIESAVAGRVVKEAKPWRK